MHEGLGRSAGFSGRTYTRVILPAETCSYGRVQEAELFTHTPIPLVRDQRRTSMPNKPEKPRVSIVVVNYNGKHFLSDCFSAIFRQTNPPFEVIMVDNASRDGSVGFVREHFPAVHVLVNETNRGFAGGTNVGIRKATGEYILTLNNDTQLDASFLLEIMKPMVEDPRVGMCASKMLFPDGRINSTGICISRSGAAWDRGMFEPDRGQYNHQEEVFGPCAGAALYRRRMLDEIGLFDEDFFLFMEDVDLAFRARLSGWRCIYVPSAWLVHEHGGTAGFKSDISIYHGNRNLVWYVVKNLPVKLLLLYLPWILLRNIADIPYYALQGKFRTIMRAKWDMVRGIRRMIQKRNSIRRTESEDEIAKWFSVWSGARIRPFGQETRSTIP
jgi:hypothetical protein